MLHEDMKYHFEGFPPTAHPMAILSAMINAASCFYPELTEPSTTRERFEHAGRAAALPGAHHRGLLLPQVARACRSSIPKPDLQVHGELPAHDVLASPYEDYELKPGGGARRWT